MNKVLVTGLGVASDLGICESCNLDFSWLTNNSSIVLWADKISIPQIALEKQLMRRDDKHDKAIGLFLDLADEHGLIDKIDLANKYTENVGEQLYKEALTKSEALLRSFPGTIRKGEKGVPDELFIEDERYCGPRISSIFAGMKIAQDIGANCLFSRREHTFLKYLYGIETNNIGGAGINNIYSEVFSLYMPENIALHNYAFAKEEKCEECTHYDNCKENYLNETEKALLTMFKWREYDELRQAKEVIDKIISLKNQISSPKDIDDVVKEFSNRQAKINKNLHQRFPKIERWSKMTTVLSVPISIASAASGNFPLTVGSVAVTGIAKATENILDVYRSKTSWVGFVNDMKNGRLAK